MKKIIMIVISFMLFISINAFGATYYIDYESVDDSNNGTSESTPFKHCPFDSRFSGASSPAAGDNFYFKRGVIYEAGTSQTGNLISMTTGGSSNSTRITFGAYGSGDRPIIAGGKQLDESQFSLYSGNVYRATNSSLGLTGINLIRLFEADKYATFSPHADPYDEEGSIGAVDVSSEFHQVGTSAGD